MSTMRKLDYDDLIERAVRLKHDLLIRGYWRSMHAMDAVTQELGWEAAQRIERAMGGTGRKSNRQRERYVRARNR